MAYPLHSESYDTAIVLLEYMHAPVVGLYFAGAATFGICVLHKPQTLPVKKGRLATYLMLSILTSYFAETLYFISHSLAKDNYSAPQHAVIHCLESLLVWGPLSFGLVGEKSARWYPFLGAFVLELLFETVICFVRGFDRQFGDRFSTIPLALNALRAFISLIMVINGFLILINRRSEKGIDEEGQSLLGKPANGTAAAQNRTTDYGSIPQDSSEDEDEEGYDPQKEIKEQQAKRLEEEGGWIGYLKGFSIFLPYLWPKDDWFLMLCLFLRFLHLLQARFLNLLAPRQIGIITDKLYQGTKVMPWKDIGLWAFYNWFNSFAGFGIIDHFASTVVQNSAYKRITLLAYRHVMSLSMDFHTNKHSGEVLKAVEQASSLNYLVELVLFEVAPVFLDIGVALWYVTQLFDAYMAFGVLFIGVLYVWIGLSATTWSQPKRRVWMERNRNESQVVNESIHNWQTVSYFNRAKFEESRYGSAVFSTIKAQYSYMFRSSGGHALQNLVTTLGFVGCCSFAISQVISGQKPVGNLVTFLMYWDNLLSPLWMMAYSYKHLSSCLVDAERLLQLLNTKPTVMDNENAKPLVVKEGRVEFKDVNFAYDPRKQIIKDASFIAEPGQTVAFVGETGGGKSTILKLLNRFYDVTGGSIMIDGQDLRSVTKDSLWDALGVVPQDSTLFNRSIRDNVRYARLDATDAEIEDACRAAAVHDAIMSFPDGYNSKVGERGIKLSGGQLQRIAIARVLLKNPKIVLLDEATSAIDSGVEAKIQEAFKELSAGRTTFVIAHRLSTVAEADQIIVIDQGKIIERGTHHELLEIEGGKYAELWSKQTAGHSAMNSNVGSKAASACGDGETPKPELLIDITPPQDEDDEENAAKKAKSSGRSDGSSDEDNGATKRKP